MGYHKREIKKGVLGELSKITEEYEELLDAGEQNNPVLELCELADLLGAIDRYAFSQYQIDVYGLLKMMEATKSAFEEGKRK